MSTTRTKAATCPKAGDIVLTTYGVATVISTASKSKCSPPLQRLSSSSDGQAKGAEGKEDKVDRGQVGGRSSSGSSSSDSGNGGDDTSFFRARLWRIPGKSMLSSSVAFLRNDTIIKFLPAAPGMRVAVNGPLDADADADANAGQTNPSVDVPVIVLVHCYSAENDAYVVSRADEDNSPAAAAADVSAGTSGGISGCSLSSPLAEKKKQREQPRLFRQEPSRLRPATCAKFYPLMDELVRRGDEAAAQLSGSFGGGGALLLSRDGGSPSNAGDSGVVASRNAASAAVAVGDGAAGAAPATASGGACASDRRANAKLAAAAGMPVVTSREVKGVYALLRDEELTSLLERGKERLGRLLSRDVLTESAERALESAGIEMEMLQRPRRTATSAAAADCGSGAVIASSSSALDAVRERAFAALEGLLSSSSPSSATEEDGGKYCGGDDAAQCERTARQFATSFDLLAGAAASDETLRYIFDDVSERTKSWQDATGRLLETRSASLFAEGTKRLRDRAARILSAREDKLDEEGQEEETEGAGDFLTKAFTEGDVAVARLKSIELGDALRSRLFSAIEARSESYGGLDGIIAGALAALGGGDDNDDAEDGLNEQQRRVNKGVRDEVEKLRASATAGAAAARETLLSVLSERSAYRDAVLLRIESTLVDLDPRMGDDVGADDLVALVRGEGGTAALFEPIAKRAARDIEAQLSKAEESVSDPTALGVLSRVRRIVSGDLTLEGVIGELGSVLNDEEVVAASESLIKRGELMLDALESGSAAGGNAMGDVMNAVEKAGITKKVVMDHVGSMDMNSLLTTAESAMTDEQARQQLLSQATDSALDFLLRILPSMPIPPFDGVRDGLLYHLSNLSMEGFKVKKEDIHVKIAGIAAAISRKKNGEGVFDENGAARAAAKPTEILCIYVRNISAVFENALWSFEQTYMPYLKGSGIASAKLWGGTIRLRFGLRKLSTSTDSGGKTWEPVLCLNDRDCRIEELDLQLHGEGKLTWIVNKLSSIFKVPLRDYVVRIIMDAITSRSGWLLENLNSVISPYWPLLLKTTSLSLDDLKEVSSNDVVASTPNSCAKLIDLVWRQRVPLGINLLLNDDSGYVKVVDFPRGSQARQVAQEKKLDADIFKGATIVAVDGTRYEQFEQESVMIALRDPGRPKTINFQLADEEEAERVRGFVKGREEKKAQGEPPELREEANEVTVKLVEIADDGPIGLKFANSPDRFCLLVSSFLKGPGGVNLTAERTGKISLGDFLISVNGSNVIGADGVGPERALEALQSAKTRPLTLGFVEPYISSFMLKAKDVEGMVGGPEELVLAAKKTASKSSRVVIERFKDVDGVAESKGVLIGDHLIFINGQPVGAGCRLHRVPFPDLKEVVALLESEEYYPIVLTFARPGQTGSRWTASYSLDVETAETFCLAATNREQLGFDLRGGRARGEVVVKAFHAVEGLFQKELKKTIRNGKGLAFEFVDRQVVPSYADTNMVMNAMKRCWSAKRTIDIVLCDDARREWIRKQLVATS